MVNIRYVPCMCSRARARARARARGSAPARSMLLSTGASRTNEQISLANASPSRFHRISILQKMPKLPQRFDVGRFFVHGSRMGTAEGTKCVGGPKSRMMPTCG
jgi:hypothetical protein